MSVQNIEEYENRHEEVVPTAPPQEVTKYDKRRRETPAGPRTPNGSEESEKPRRRRSGRRRISADSARSRSRSPGRRRYFEEYRPRRRYEPEFYRPYYGPYYSVWRPRGRGYWRGSGGPMYARGRGWYGGFERRTRFYQPRYSVRYEPRGEEWYEDGFEYGRMRSQERVRREDYEDRRSRRHERRYEHDRRREDRTHEDRRGDVTSSRKEPADYNTENMHRSESTYNSNYAEINA